MAKEQLSIHAVILAGGRGTRFWPRSRTTTPKQLLSIIGKGTMLEQTVARLRPLVAPDHIWTVTNAEQDREVRKQVPKNSRRRVLVEPVGRNTAAAIGLAAFHIRHAAKGDALMAVLPADHYIAQTREYLRIVAAALNVAREASRMVVLGILPTRPETGFGYIERLEAAIGVRGISVYPVRRFTEKPALETAKQYLASGNYQWNAGMFFWRVSTLLGALEKHLPQTYSSLERIAATIGKRKYAAQLRKVYPKLENISVDYAILEKATQDGAMPRVLVIPAEVGWSDIGSWEAVYELLARTADDNVLLGPAHTMDSSGNFISSPGKFVAAIGVRDLVVVDTDDALLICPRHRAQDVGKIVKWLEAQKLKRLL
jgi:mannose-1-phosphate guanylyltransferase